MHFVFLADTKSDYLINPSWLLLEFVFRKIVRRWWFDRYAFLFQLAMIMETLISGFFCI